MVVRGVCGSESLQSYIRSEKRSQNNLFSNPQESRSLGQARGQVETRSTPVPRSTAV